MDIGLRGELEKSGVGDASFVKKQEEAIAAVTNMIMMIASKSPSRLVSFLKASSSDSPEIEKVFNKFQEDHLINALHSAGGLSFKKLNNNNDNMIATSTDDATRHGV